MTEPPAVPSVPSIPGRAPARGGLRISLPAIVIALAMLGALGFIAYAVFEVQDGQIPLLASGFTLLGASLAAIAAWTVLGIWRAASYAMTGRAAVLALLGGFAALAAIGCFTVAVLFAMVWNT